MGLGPSLFTILRVRISLSMISTRLPDLKEARLTVGLQSRSFSTMRATNFAGTEIFGLFTPRNNAVPELTLQTVAGDGMFVSYMHTYIIMDNPK